MTKDFEEWFACLDNRRVRYLAAGRPQDLLDLEYLRGDGG